MQAIRDEAYQRSLTMLEGVSSYQESQQERTSSKHNVIWTKGNARLLDYGGSQDDPAILCIPSLINKPYILDLYPKRSFVNHLYQKGYRPLVLDWGEPGNMENRYDCSDYVYHMAADAFRQLRQQHDGPIYVLGYCMGGIFALALAQLEAFYVDGLILLATPWDYQPDGKPPIDLDEDLLTRYEAMLMEQKTVPPVWIQTIFHMLNPWHFQKKFSRFTTMSNAEREHFIAVESWANDGMPLTRYAARDCLIDWPQNNTLAEGRWRVGGWRIDPSKVTCPTFIAAPTEDKIVPLDSATFLNDRIKNSTCITPSSGHVSMLVGPKAKKECWNPLCQWVAAQHT